MKVPRFENPIGPLRERMIEDMTVRGFVEKSKHDYVRHVENFVKFLGRSPETASSEDVRRFQVHQTEMGKQPPSMNSSVAALRFYFTITAWAARTWPPARAHRLSA